MADDQDEVRALKGRINPPARRRVLPAASETPKLEPASGQGGGRRRPPPETQVTSPDDEPPRPYKVGYKHPPIETRFVKNNPGGPGRPKEKKSQDTLLREELSRKRPIKVGNRLQKVTTLQLLNTLRVDGALKDRDHRQITPILAEARRLFPEQLPEMEPPKAHDPEADRALLQQMARMLSIGEPDPDSSDPLRDISLGSPDLGGGTEADGWDEGDWDASGEETSDDDL